MAEIVWTTKDGDRLRMDEIGDQHLLNIIKLLKRKRNEYVRESESAACFFQGEVSQQVFAQDVAQDLALYDERISKFSLEARAREILPADEHELV